MGWSKRVLAVVSGLVLTVPLLAVPAAGTPDGAHGGERVDVIAVLEDHVRDRGRAARNVARDHDVDLDLVYEHAIGGLAGSVPEGRLEGLRHDRRVAYVERDQPVEALAQSVPTGVQRIFADDNAELGIDGNDDARVDVDVAVIDTGIDLDHPDLDVVASTDCSGGGPFGGSCGSGGDDDNGHGTHVAGSAAALDNGLGVVGAAPGARLHAVKVLDSSGSGYISWIVAGIDYVTAHADTIEVANMSLGCECSSDAMDDAIAASVDAGVVYAVAAGNDGQDAATFSPANHPDVITVSALADFDGEPGGTADPTCRDDQDDTLADFSNFGSTIDIAAPGVCIRSTVPGGGYDTYSGTSMASPHAAGAAALLASGANDPTSQADVEAIRDTLVAEGNSDWTDDSGDGIHEPLLDVGDTTVFDPALTSDGDTNTAPTAQFTAGCPDLTCDFDASGSSDSDGSIAGYDWDLGDGTTATGETVTHTYDSGGDYTVTLTVTDDDGATDSTSQTVSASADSGGESADGPHVGDLDGAATNNGSTWTATVTVLVHDANGDPLSDATVSFDYVSERGAQEGSVSCKTDGNGLCDVAVNGIPKRDGTVTFTVTAMDVDGYSSTDNHDPDGDSDGTMITVSK